MVGRIESIINSNTITTTSRLLVELLLSNCVLGEKQRTFCFRYNTTNSNFETWYTIHQVSMTSVFIRVSRISDSSMDSCNRNLPIAFGYVRSFSRLTKALIKAMDTLCGRCTKVVPVVSI